MSALHEIRRLATQGRVIYTRHAEQRMDERRVKRSDVIHALTSATDARWQADRQTFAVTGGVDMTGDELTVIVVIQDDVLVVTLF